MIPTNRCPVDLPPDILEEVDDRGKDEWVVDEARVLQGVSKTLVGGSDAIEGASAVDVDELVDGSDVLDARSSQAVVGDLVVWAANLRQFVKAEFHSAKAVAAQKVQQTFPDISSMSFLLPLQYRGGQVNAVLRMLLEAPYLDDVELFARVRVAKAAGGGDVGDEGRGVEGEGVGLGDVEEDGETQLLLVIGSSVFIGRRRFAYRKNRTRTGSAFGVGPGSVPWFETRMEKC